MGSSSSNPIKPQPKPLAFHRLHGENAQISPDWKRAKRLRGFEHAITISDRPLTLNRYIDIRVLDTSPAWRGAMRIGVSAQHPGNLTRNDLPSCACPGLTERDKFWAAPVPEARATLGSELYVYVTTQGDVMCGTTAGGKRRAWEEDCLLSGVPTGGSLWLVLDIYGQTMEVEMFEPKAALTIVTNSPDGGAAQRAAAKVRGSEDPVTENSINTTLLQQREDGQGTSTGTTTTQGPSESTSPTAPSPDESSHPPPSIHGTLNAETPQEEKQPEVGKEAEPEQGSKAEEPREEPPTSVTYDDDADDKVAPSVEKVEENADTEVASECTVCMDAAVDCTLYKCGHMCMCHTCATDLKEKPDPECPVCREPIVDVIKTYQN